MVDIKPQKSYIKTMGKEHEMTIGSKWLLKTCDESGKIDEADSWIPATFDGTNLIGASGVKFNAWLDAPDFMEPDNK